MLIQALLTVAAFILPAQAPPLANLREVPFNQVKIADEFWAPRRETNRTVSLAHSLDKLEEAGNIINLELAAAGKHEGYHGPVFMDSDLYKGLEAVSYSLATDPDPALNKRLDEIIAKIAAAQMADGYLNTWYQVNAPDKRFTNLRDNHELYCAGHLFEAAAAHRQATQSKTLLNIATKYADLLCNTFGDGTGKRPGYCGHPEIELALVKLSRITGEKKYFDLAKHFVDTRGSHFFAREHNTPDDKYDGEYWQDNCPIREHDHIVGHAVRAAYLMSACTDIGAETSDESLLKMVRRIWRNTTERNTYITGGIGPSAANEGFTHDYDLPNESAYQETCASVAMAMWNHRLNLAYGDSKYADSMETALYNGVLSGVSLDGKKFFYVNPLTSQGAHHRSDWFGCACCPPNVTRTLAQLGNYIYAQDHTGMWVNLYVQGSVATNPTRHHTRVDVKTRYPWDGKVELSVTRIQQVGDWSLHLRVPGWCQGATVSINKEPVADPKIERGYITLTRDWKSEDLVELNLPMPIRRVEADPNVEADRGHLAIARGPLVYCVENVDARFPILASAIPADAELTAVKRPELLGGVVTIEGKALYRPAERPIKSLYRPAQPAATGEFTAIPYYAWDNRAAGPMQVWFPTTPPPPKAYTLEAQAKVAMSYVGWNCDPNAAHDGNEPKKSSENPGSNCHWWSHKGGTEWISYTWAMPTQLSSVKVFWFDDTGHGECRLPKSARLLAKSGDSWTPVGDVPIAIDRWCELKFKPVTTDSLKIEIQMQDKWSAGILEWKVAVPDEE